MVTPATVFLSIKLDHTLV
uniref:Uncharacterized protein n=1 Tax=Arundo donax TaxID=35708 RepID=A0A0A9H407_ARUDO